MSSRESWEPGFQGGRFRSRSEDLLFALKQCQMEISSYRCFPRCKPAEKKVEKIMQALPVLERNLLRLMAFYRTVHGQSLRVHEELSRNLGLNIGDLVVAEEIIARKFADIIPDAAAAQLSPVCYLVLFLYFLDEPQVTALGGALSSILLPGSAGGSTQLLRALLTKSVREFVARTAVHAERGGHSASTDSSADKAAAFAIGSKVLSEFRLCLQSKNGDYLLNKWAGTAAIFIATIDSLSRSGLDWASKLNSDVVDGLGNLTVRATVSYNTPEDAVAGMRSILVSQQYEGAPISLPALTPFTASLLVVPKKPQTVLRRKEVPPPDSAAQAAAAQAAAGAEAPPPPTWDERIRSQFEGWHLVLTPTEGGVDAPGSADPLGTRPLSQGSARPPSQATTRPSSKSSKKEVFTREMEVAYINSLPSSVIIELCVTPSQLGKLCPLFMFSPSREEEEFVIPPLKQISVSSFSPEQLKINATFSEPDRSDAIVGQLSSFIDRVLGDAKKASMSSGKICTRLMSQFVPPHHCHRHPVLRYAFFCSRCRKFICASCTNESHSGHPVEPISSFCMNEALRLEPKAIQLSHRVGALKQILATLDRNTERMKQLVDDSVNDVLLRINSRRQLLHQDSEERAQVQLRLLRQERVALDSAVDRINHAKYVVQQVSSGCVTAIPSVKPLLSRQVVDQLHPRLPTEQLKRLVRVLTWSNPSKYLTQFIYPPPPIDLSKTKVMVPMALQGPVSSTPGTPVAESLAANVDVHQLL